MKYIKLYNSDKQIIVDDNLFEELNKYQWRLSPAGYPRATIGGKGKGYHGQNGIRMYIYHLIIGIPPKGMMTDHVNSNPLDNRKCNLRFCDYQGNGANQKKRENCSSIYKGVRWNQIEKTKRGTYIKRKKPWCAACEYNNKTIHIGRYKTEEEAALAYNKKAKELWGEYAKLNIVGGMI